MRPGRSGDGREDGDRWPERPLDEAGRQRFAQVLAQAVAEPDPQAAPALLCGACVELLDVSGASVSLSDGSSPGILWWASDKVAGELAEAQYSLGDGPCTTALARVAPVMAADLTQGPDADRWPMFAQRAVALGVHAVFSLPLGGEALAFGTLDLYRREPGPLSQRDQELVFPACDALTYAMMRIQSDTADIAAIAGAAGASDADADAYLSWMDGAQDDHEEVNQATGMVMVQLEVDPRHALARLRAYAFANGLTVTEVARQVVSCSLRFDE